VDFADIVYIYLTMKTLPEIKAALTKHKTVLFRKYHLIEMGIFGSVSRGETTSESDIDILIDYEGQMGLEFVDLAEELEAILNSKVDLVSKQAVKPKLLARIKTDLIYV
jgi:predicted nucleotidyltransferase